jgi:hypothetical protein
MLCIKDSVQGKEEKATLFLKNDRGVELTTNPRKER